MTRYPMVSGGLRRLACAWVRLSCPASQNLNFFFIWVLTEQAQKIGNFFAEILLKNRRLNLIFFHSFAELLVETDISLIFQWNMPILFGKFSPSKFHHPILFPWPLKDDIFVKIFGNFHHLVGLSNLHTSCKIKFWTSKPF